ncbi:MULTISPECIES: response regulator transcription factor [Pseudomonas]|uniref:Response regulator transcription factor n=1 Tax=Pseudomonas idahonensis TaxID=2942628 RepID=A0ABT5Q1U3_9PSED|nr:MULTISPECIES: response regulator transcription factor [Pseudomonas]MBS7556966.1 response regulator transcription factor [Pseudomonas sp. RC4D1]MBW8352298.1 response regulator transcription factor [Pseudomonas sp.]MCY7263086.1 response regulator transcription factor [Pseudomonas protegens]MDC7818114.1 response regulator transcription factor [Pseudomonas sp. BLCC-B112]MDD1021068.1 response regulator transcription factor [Pseudomonas idahonensis]
MRVAILDDEPAELARVEQTLREIPGPGEAAWSLHRFERGEDLLRQLRRETFDLLILDWQVPDLSGLSLLRWTREHMDSPPAAIMLTSRDAESDIVQALNTGADDYLSKPFRPNELKARVNAVLRRHGLQRSNSEEVLTFNDLSFDDAELTVTRAGAPISLTEREYRLARCLFANLGRPLSREYLYERFWTHEEIISSRPLDTHIYRLRNKLGLTADRGWQLLTIYGYGYRLESVASPDEQGN